MVSPSEGSYPSNFNASEYEPSLVPKLAGIKNITEVRNKPKTYKNNAWYILNGILRK